MKNYTLDIYSSMFISLKRGRSKYGISNAKPIFLLSIIESFPCFDENAIKIDSKELRALYDYNSRMYNKSTWTPIATPFYHMKTESFYSLIWEPNVIFPPNIHTPSEKFLRDNLLYAKLEDELWKLLQDVDSRAYLRNIIIKTYF